MPTAVLELLRAGEAHNHLVSPSQTYLALIGSHAPSPVTLPWEHRDLRQRLTSLRYRSAENIEVPEEQRAAILDELGREVGSVLGQIKGLCHAIAGARRMPGELTHLRLVLTGDELAMVPWEAARTPAELGVGDKPLLLQDGVPVALTREVRGASRRDVEWAQVPRVLFVVSDLEEFPAGTAEAHLLALSSAVRDWTLPSRDGRPSRSVTVLIGADVATIEATCARTTFTHVHILAHGAESENRQDRTYGVRLRAPGPDRAFETVSGERLAYALGAGRTDARGGHLLMVSLATCDSANVATVVVPGGSVAHELHRAGVPWVIASQLPLTIEGSAWVAEFFLPQVLQGLDPRQALCGARLALRTRFDRAHDWVSLVAYASIPTNFDVQVANLRKTFERYRRNRVYAQLDRLWRQAREAAGEPGGDPDSTGPLEAVLAQLQEVHAAWSASRVRLATTAEPQDRAARAVWYANGGSILKRIAQVEWMLDRPGASLTSLRAALAACTAGMDEAAGDHWVTGQRLVMATVVGGGSATPALLGDAWAAAALALYSKDPDQQMWAHTTRIEAALCALRIEPGRAKLWTRRAEDAMAEFMRRAEPGGLERTIMLTQLERYSVWWVSAQWQALVDTLIRRLQAENAPSPGRS